MFIVKNTNKKQIIQNNMESHSNENAENIKIECPIENHTQTVNYKNISYIEETEDIHFLGNNEIGLSSKLSLFIEKYAKEEKVDRSLFFALTEVIVDSFEMYDSTNPENEFHRLLNNDGLLQFFFANQEYLNDALRRMNSDNSLFLEQLLNLSFVYKISSSPLFDTKSRISVGNLYIRPNADCGLSIQPMLDISNGFKAKFHLRADIVIGALTMVINFFKDTDHSEKELLIQKFKGQNLEEISKSLLELYRKVNKYYITESCKPALGANGRQWDFESRNNVELSLNFDDFMSKVNKELSENLSILFNSDLSREYDKYVKVLHNTLREFSRFFGNSNKESLGFFSKLSLKKQNLKLEEAKTIHFSQIGCDNSYERQALSIFYNLLTFLG